MNEEDIQKEIKRSRLRMLEYKRDRLLDEYLSAKTIDEILVLDLKEKILEQRIRKLKEELGEE